MGIYQCLQTVACMIIHMHHTLNPCPAQPMIGRALSRPGSSVLATMFPRRAGSVVDPGGPRFVADIDPRLPASDGAHGGDWLL